MLTLNPFDPRTLLLARHAQHVVLIHFPIALFISGVGFDFAGLWSGRKHLAEAAYYNLLTAAAMTSPALATGVLAWQLQLEGQKLKGVLLLHLVLACVSSGLIWLVWWVHYRRRKCGQPLPCYRIWLELLAVAAISLTGHLGGFLSGVNVPV